MRGQGQEQVHVGLSHRALIVPADVGGRAQPTHEHGQALLYEELQARRRLHVLQGTELA
jgi:hypothetical protein